LPPFVGCGDTVYTESHGYVSSPKYPSNYGDNQNCSNIIWAYKPASFEISFLHINLEECCDFVEVRGLRFSSLFSSLMFDILLLFTWHYCWLVQMFCGQKSSYLYI